MIKQLRFLHSTKTRTAHCDVFCACHQVEALKNHRVTDMACGSGDAQTLCITDDDTVWSWGDGDYGKLGMLEFSPGLSPHWLAGLKFGGGGAASCSYLALNTFHAE